jgi:hypothetical protein
MTVSVIECGEFRPNSPVNPSFQAKTESHWHVQWLSFWFAVFKPPEPQNFSADVSQDLLLDSKVDYQSENCRLTSLQALPIANGSRQKLFDNSLPEPQTTKMRSIIEIKIRFPQVWDSNLLDVRWKSYFRFCRSDLAWANYQLLPNQLRFFWRWTELMKVS